MDGISGNLGVNLADISCYVEDVRPKTLEALENQILLNNIATDAFEVTVAGKNSYKTVTDRLTLRSEKSGKNSA